MRREDAVKLSADGIVELFKIELVPSGVIYLKDRESLTWQGNIWERWPISLSGVSNSSDEQNARPKLTVANPEAFFSDLIGSGTLDDARVLRYRVLGDDVLNDRNVFSLQSWKVSRTMSLNRNMAVFELRNLLDTPFFKTPGRRFVQPEFPTVRLR